MSLYKYWIHSIRSFQLRQVVNMDSFDNIPGAFL